MQCNCNSFIQLINFHGLFRNDLRCQKTGTCRILVPLRYHHIFQVKNNQVFDEKIINKRLIIDALSNNLIIPCLQ